MELFRILAGRRALCPPNHQQPSGREAGWSLLAASFTALLLLVPGCRHRSSGDDPQIRLIDTVADSDSVRVTLSGRSPVGDLQFGSATSYRKIPAGSYDVQFSAEDSGQPPSHFPILHIDAQRNHRYTGIAIGHAQAWPRAHVVVFDDQPLQPLSDNQAWVRVVDAYPSSRKIDFIVNNVVAFHHLAFGEESDPILLPSGPCDVKAIEAGTYSSPMAGPMPVSLEDDSSYLIILAGPDTEAKSGLLIVADR